MVQLKNLKVVIGLGEKEVPVDFTPDPKDSRILRARIFYWEAKDPTKEKTVSITTNRRGRRVTIETFPGAMKAILMPRSEFLLPVPAVNVFSSSIARTERNYPDLVAQAEHALGVLRVSYKKKRRN